MSIKIRKTKFGGYKFQHSAGVEHLTKMMSTYRENHRKIKESLSKMDSFVEYDPCPIQPTEDGYHWYGLAKFKKGNVTIVVLFPWIRIFDGFRNPLERPVAIYSDDDYSEEELLNLVSEISYVLTKRR